MTGQRIDEQKNAGMKVVAVASTTYPHLLHILHMSTVSVYKPKEIQKSNMHDIMTCLAFSSLKRAKRSSLLP